MVKGIENIATKEDVIGFSGLLGDIRKAHKELIKWMFFFQITQTLAIAGILYYFF